jgi:hypothetical protein
MELVELIDRAIAARGADAEDDARAVRLDAERFRALAAVAELLPPGPATGDLAAWLAARERFITYDASAGRHRLRPEPLRRAHERHRMDHAAAAEPILWTLAESGFPGECEGSLTCYVARTDAAEGEYLRWYPEGRHVREAVRRITENAGWWESRIRTGLGFDASTHCREIAPLFGTLRFALESAADAGRDEAIRRLDAARAPCR